MTISSTVSNENTVSVECVLDSPPGDRLFGDLLNIGVIVLAATNRPETLDPALLRPGRFERQVLVDRPELSGRQAIWEIYASQVKLSQDVDLKVLAARTPGFSGADLENLINEAALLAARNNRQEVIQADFGEAIDKEVKAIVETAHQQALDILQSNRDLLDTIATKLLETEVIEGEELQGLLERVKPATDYKDNSLIGFADSTRDVHGMSVRSSSQ